MSVSYASRQAVGLVLGELEGEDDLVCSILSQYSFRGDELTFVVTLARLVCFGRDEEEIGELLFRLACDQASR